MHPSRPAALCLAALVLAVAGCGEEEQRPATTDGAGTTPEKAEGGTITIAGQKANDHGRADVSGKSRVELEMDDFYFEPTLLVGTPGQRIGVVVRNEGKVRHNLSIEGQRVDEDVEPGAMAAPTLRFPKSGQLVFVCKYHTAQDMRGGLAVGGGGGAGDDSPSEDDSGAGGGGY